jgi:hypothetical protein
VLTHIGVSAINHAVKPTVNKCAREVTRNRLRRANQTSHVPSLYIVCTEVLQRQVDYIIDWFEFAHGVFILVSRREQVTILTASRCAIFNGLFEVGWFQFGADSAPSHLDRRINLATDAKERSKNQVIRRSP